MIAAKQEGTSIPMEGESEEHCYVTHAGLQLVILLPPLPECWNYRHAFCARMRK
jgi:hypothetical protein